MPKPTTPKQEKHSLESLLEGINAVAEQERVQQILAAIKIAIDENNPGWIDHILTRSKVLYGLEPKEYLKHNLPGTEVNSYEYATSLSDLLGDRSKCTNLLKKFASNTRDYADRAPSLKTLKEMIDKAKEREARLIAISQALQLAIEGSRPELLKAVIEHVKTKYSIEPKAYINSILYYHDKEMGEDWPHGFTLLMLAANIGDIEAVKTLVTEGAAVSQTLKDNTTALNNALEAGNKEIALYLNRLTRYAGYSEAMAKALSVSLFHALSGGDLDTVYTIWKRFNPKDLGLFLETGFNSKKVATKLALYKITDVNARKKELQNGLNLVNFLIETLGNYKLNVPKKLVAIREILTATISMTAKPMVFHSLESPVKGKTSLKDHVVTLRRGSTKGTTSTSRRRI